MTREEEQKKWETEDAARTIEQYAEISADSKLFNAAKKILQEKKEKIDKILKKLNTKG